jgi:hypothetical protein
MINSYVRAGDSDRGDWAFRGRVRSTSKPIGPKRAEHLTRVAPDGRQPATCFSTKRPYRALDALGVAVPNVSLQADLSPRVAVGGAAAPWHSSWKEFVGWSWAKRETANRSMAQPVKFGPLPNAKTLSAMYNNAVAVARLRSTMTTDQRNSDDIDAIESLCKPGDGYAAEGVQQRESSSAQQS